MPNTKTIELTGSETEVRFGENYPYFWVRNHGSGDVYMSASPDVVPGADGVTVIPAGVGRSTGDLGQANTLYFLGSGKIEISPQHNAVCPFFKRGGKGGEISGSGLDIKIVASLPDTGESKYLYLVPKNDLLSDNIYDEYLWVEGKWEKIGTTEINAVSDYNDLENKPSVEGTVLEGDIALKDIGLENYLSESKYISVLNHDGYMNTDPNKQFVTDVTCGVIQSYTDVSLSASVKWNGTIINGSSYFGTIFPASKDQAGIMTSTYSVRNAIRCTPSDMEHRSFRYGCFRLGEF